MVDDKPLRILVVEDEPDVGATISLILEDAFSAEIEVARDAAQARELLARGGFDIVTLDHKLPDCPGIELLDEIAAAEVHPDVIMVTGKGDEDLAMRSIMSGAAGYVVKDPRLKVLLTEAVEKVLARVALKRTEEELELEHMLTKVALDALPDVFIVFDLEGRPLRWNKACEAVTGYSAEEIETMNILDTYDETEVPRIVGAIQQIIDDGVYKFEATIVAKDGNRVPLSITAALVRDKEGSPMAICGAGKDMSERKRAEEALRNVIRETNERREEITALLESTRYVLEHQDFNDAARAIFELCKKLVGANAGFVAVKKRDTSGFEMMLVLPEGLAAGIPGNGFLPLVAPFEEVFESGRTMFENDFQNSRWAQHLPEDHVHISNALITPLLIEGEAAGLIVLTNKPGGFTSRDSLMTSAFGEIASLALRNRLTLDLLEDSEQRFRSVAVSANEAIIIADRHARIVFWNRAAEAIFGRSMEDVEGEPITVCLPERLWKANIQSMMRTLSESPPEAPGKTYELIGLRKNGEEFPMELSRATWEVAGEPYFTAIIRDITDRKKAEAELRESEERYRRVVETAPDVIYTISGEGLLTSLNPAFERWTGWSRDEWLNKPFSGLIHPDDLEKALATFVRASRGETTQPYELRILSKSGEWRIGEFVSAPQIEGGEVVGEFGMARDVTERKHAEDALKEAERKYRGIFENLIMGIFQSNPAGELISTNPAMARMLGYDSPEETMESIKNMVDLYVEPTERQRLLAMLDERGFVEGFEVEVNRKDGSTTWGRLSVKAIIGEDGGIERYEGVVEEIGEEKRAKAALKESEELYRSLLLTSPDAVVVTDLRGFITNVSTSALELYGTDEPDDLMGKSSFELLDESDHARAAEGMARTLVDGVQRNLEYSFRRKDDTRYVGELNASVLRDAEGEPRGFIASIRDITERKRFEHELQSLNNELEGYAHAVSHDLKGPLASIMVASATLQSLLRRHEPEGLSEALDEIAEVIDESVRKSAALIEDLLELAEVAQKPTEVGEVDVGVVVRSVLEEKQQAIESRKVRVTVSDDLGTVRANPTHVYQVFMNLIDNAVKHNDSEKPDISISRVASSDGTAGPFRISDNGPGIPGDDLEDIFLPFFSGEMGDSGIGLATVDKIVKVYGGSIRAFNEGGAVFDFSFEPPRP